VPDPEIVIEGSHTPHLRRELLAELVVLAADCLKKHQTMIQ
jgi:hypothetical protein